MGHTKSPVLVATMDHFFLGTVAEPWCEEEEETEEGLGWLPCSFNPDSPFEKKWLQTNGPTDGPTDGQTDRRTDKASYRDAWAHLKTTFFMVRGQVMFCIITAIVFLSFLCRFHSKSWLKKKCVTDGPTNGRTDGPTEGQALI